VEPTLAVLRCGDISISLAESKNASEFARFAVP